MRTCNWVRVGIVAAIIAVTCMAMTASAQSSIAVDGATRIAANQILNRWEPIAVAAGAHPSAWREQLLTQLSLMPPSWLQLFDALQPGNSGDAKADYARFGQMFINAQSNMMNKPGKAPVKLGSATTDLIFVPITPCRIVDTRNTGSPIAAGAVAKCFYYGDSGGFTFSTQGGIAGAAVAACPATILIAGGGTLGTVPPAAAAATVTVVNGTAAGNF